MTNKITDVGVAASDSAETFVGEIRVASRIVDYLSSGLYPSPAACLKELINNAYDADARTVYVYVKPDGDRIVIEDDGCGMSRSEFITHFERISESHKRDSSQFTEEFNRPKIGKIGIGFIAANEICEFMEIFSTKAGSRELLHVTINFSEMSRPIQERKKESGDITKADYEGEVTFDATLEEHYTHIFLERVRGEAHDILVGATSQLGEKNVKSLYGKKPETISNLLRDPSLNSWKDFDFYSETMLQVALNTPVKYSDNWIPVTPKPSYIEKIEEDVNSLDFTVYYDGTDLRKPTIFAPTIRNRNFLVEPFTFDGEHVSAKGYFYVEHGVLKPQDLHGLLVRIRNSAVGKYDSSFWGFTPTLAQIIQRWISAEIWADDRLEDAMNIDRSTLREAHPAYVELRNAIHKHLKKVIDLATRRLYKEGNIVRREQKSQESKERITEVLALAKENVSSTSIIKIENTWDNKSIDAIGQKSLLRKYSVAEVYEALIDAADGILDAKQLSLLLQRLTERLSK